MDAVATPEAPECNASGRPWTSGPYIRKAERSLWDALYREFADELRVSADYPKGVRLDDEQIDVLASNCAYRATWTARRAG